MTLAADAFANTVVDGPLVLAIGVSALAGLVSFLSPCVLPLVPGYISYVTGIAGADLDAAVGLDPHGRPVAATPASTPSGASAATPSGSGRHFLGYSRENVAQTAEGVGASAGEGAAGEASGTTRTAVAERRRVRGRVLLGSGLFVAGFTAVFTVIGATVGGLASTLVEHQLLVERVAGALIIVLGLSFIGLIPGLQREARIRRLPATGLAGAPLLGAVFGLGWIPCVGPTLSAVQGLAFTQGSAGRGVTLTIAYCLGLGIPFILFGLGLRRFLGALAVIRRHSLWVTRVGGGMLVVVGLLLVTGAWGDLVIWLYGAFGTGGVGI